MRVNLNDAVKFKLTVVGWAIYNNSRDDDLMYRPNLTICGDGYCEMQLWEFLKIFGEYMNVGITGKVVENNELIFEKEKA